MHRTAGDIRRRRHLAAVSSLIRAGVILYASISPGEDEVTARAVLAQFAEARDWRTIREVVDHDPARPGWEEVRALIESGEAEGIVSLKAACVVAATDRDWLPVWLADRRAFYTSVRPCPHDGECGA